MRRICFPRRVDGFSMIEVMVAVVVLSIGLLGMAALMATSLRNNQSANFRSQAVNLAHDMIDMIRANSTSANLYNNGAYTDPKICGAGAEAVFDYGTLNTTAADLAHWRRKLCYSLPNGRGRALVTEAATPSGRTQYDVTVDICWTDDRGEDVTTDCPGLMAGQVGACNGATCVIRVVTSI